MKASENQLLAALDAALPAIRLYLLHGPDEAGALDYAGRLGRAMGADAERITIDGGTLKGDPGRIADEARSLGLFGGRRWLLVTGVGDEAIEAAHLLIAEPRTEHPVVFVAPSLRTASKLVQFAIAQPAVLSFACYVPEGDKAERLVMAIARDHGLRPSNSAARRIAAGANGDRAVMAREIEKLALYLNATKDRPHPLDDAALDSLGAELDDAQMSDVIDAALDGRVARIGRALSRYQAAGGSAVPLLRQAVRKLMTLAAMRAEVDDGADAAAAAKKRRLHFREEGSVIRQLQRWSSPDIARAIDRIRHAERALMTSGNVGDVLSDVALVETTRAAARLR
ncbi:DNA polymerase III subunit delta [uncultured Sphingomonas sp.]|uniref:DNA polymerase III subunit delta n=1 Tax=uncultured Sphingomonas sp. TaxID=158754 RepID=UPI0035CC8B6A